MTRSMLKERKLPHTLWGEVVVTETYVISRCPTKKLEEIVPLEKWAKDKQSVSHLKVFVFVCYKHVPDAKRRKLDDRSKVMLLVGCHSTSAYKLYCIITNKVEFIRDIIVKAISTEFDIIPIYIVVIKTSGMIFYGVIKFIPAST